MRRKKSRKTSKRRKSKKQINEFLHHKPFIAAILNFFVWGAGFMYVGRVYYGFLWLFAAILVVLPVHMAYPLLPIAVGNYLTAGYLLISVLLAIDAYFDAVKVLKWKA